MGRIRMAGLADLAAIVALERASATAPHWRPEVYREIVERASPAVGAERCLLVGGVIEGFAVGSIAAGEGELESVVVAPAWQRRGLGGALCREVVGWCRERGAERIRLEVRASSVGAICLYEGLGFKVAGRRPRYYAHPEEDAVLMVMPLG